MTTAAEDLAKIDSLIAKFKVTETAPDAFQALKHPPAKTVPPDSEATTSKIANAAVAPEAKNEPNTEQEIARDAEDQFGDGPLTEKEAIQLVKGWAAFDEEVDSSKRETFDEMVKNLLAASLHRTSDLSVSRIKEIVATYAPDAPRSRANLQQDTHEKHDSAVSHPYPPELAPLVKSGVARFANGCWFVNRCYGCGQFKNTCCGQIRSVSAVRDDGQTFTGYGRQAVGLDPIRPVEPPKSQEQILQEKMANIQTERWWNQFRGVSELEGDGTLKMYIENFLPEGVTLLCGLYKEGKSFLALSIAKALTSGRPLWERPGYEVPETVPVLYLAAESGDSELKMRCKKFGITEDKTRFITRTLSRGPMLGLNDANLESLVKAMKPVIILETLIRFTEGDEDDASDNSKRQWQTVLTTWFAEILPKVFVVT